MSKGTGSERFMAIGDISVILIGTRGTLCTGHGKLVQLLISELIRQHKEKYCIIKLYISNIMKKIRMTYFLSWYYNFFSQN